jgi:hypothetical protein
MARRLLFFSMGWNTSFLHSAAYLEPVTGSLSSGINRPGREADHSPPSSAEVKNAWRYTSGPIRIHGMVLS